MFYNLFNFRVIIVEVQMVNIDTTNLMQRNWPESVPWTEKNWS